MLSQSLQATFNKKKSCLMLSQYSWDNIAQVKTLCNVVKNAPDNKKKILFNVVSVFLGQHCTGKKPMQCCPRGSRQHCIVNILCNVDLILLGQRSTGKRYAMLSQRLQTTSYRKIIQAIQAMSEQHLVTLFTYVCIRSFTSKKYKVIFSWLWKLAGTQA